MPATLFQYNFIQHAVLAGILASVLCGIIGVIIVEKKLLMMSGGIAHTSYGGVGLGYLLGFEPIIGALVICVAAALGISYIKRKKGTGFDVEVGLLWSFGMALGILFISLMPGYPPDLSSYLFGNILSITKTDLNLMTLMTFLIIFTVIALFNYWKAYMFDEEFMTVMGIKTAFFDYLIFVLVAISVVILIRVVGIILVLALFTSPTAIAALLTRSLKLRMFFSVLIAGLFCLTGLWVSYVLNIASGATIVIISVLVYLVAQIIFILGFRTRARNMA